MNVTTFKKQEEPKRRVSKIDKFKNEILELYDSQYSVQQIKEFLKLNSIVVTTREIYYFMERETKRNENS